nr:ribonuclease H-like domain-containing protein [Tanacetum cinerariifolium]
MESLSPQVVSAAKPPILNPNEFELWKMIIEHYFLMTDYSLWERLARKNELKARGTLLMALPDKYQLKFNIHKDAKTLMEAIEKRFGENKETKKVQKTLLKQQYENFTGLSSERLDQIHDRQQKLISQFEILGESISQEDINLKFLRSLPTEWRTHTLIWRNKTDLEEQISAVASVSAASAKIHVSALPNVDTLSNARTGRNLGANGPTSMGFDMSKIECYNCHRKGHFARECSVMVWAAMNGVFRQKRNQPTMPSWHSHLQAPLVLTMRKSQFDVISYKTGLESVEARLLVYQQNETVFEEDIKLLKLEVQLRDNALVVLQQKFEKAKQGRDDLKLKLEKFQTSCKNLSQLLATQTNDKTRLGYNTYVFTSFMFDFDEMFTFETDDSLPVSPKYNRYHSGDGYHAVPPPYTGTFMPPKPDLVFHDAPNVIETVHTTFNKMILRLRFYKNAPSFVQPNEQVKTPRPSVKLVKTFIPTANPKTATPKPKSHENSKNRKACFVCKSLTYLIKDCDYYAQKTAQTHTRNHAQRGNHQQYARMTLLNPQRHVAPTSVLSKSKLVPITATRPVTAAAPKPHVTRPRQAKTIVIKPHSPPRRHINRSPSPKASNFPPKVTAVKGPHGNPHHALKDKGVIDSGCSRNITGNMFYLSDFEEINSRYVAFGGNPKGGKISSKDTECIVLSPEFKLLDETQVLLTVPKENNMYNVDLKNIVLSKDLTCLFAKATSDESNLWRRRLGNINFKTMNKLLKGNLVRGLPSKLFENNHTCVACKRAINIEPINTDGDAAFEVKEPEFERRKPESEVHVSPSEFEDFPDNIINEVNADDSLVPAVKQILTNSTNTFSVAGPSNTVVSPTHRKSSYVDTSQYPDDPNMLELEDITYSDDKEDVGAEADFTNLETTITVSPIPTTIVHKDHLVTQIIGDLSLATQTRSMTKVAKDQGGLSQINNDDFHTSYASFMGFKSAFLYGTIKEEVYVCQPLGFEDPDYPNKVYKVMSSMGGLTFFLGLQVKQKKDGIFISHDKYVAEILRKFGLTDGKSISTPIDIDKPLLKDPDANSDSDYAGASLDRKSTTRGCQFLGCRLISWQCKKQTVVANSSTEAEYVAATSYCAQVLWIQNQLLDYGLVRNVDSSTKFYMYPRFLQLMIRAQVGDLATIQFESYEFEGEIIPCSDFRLGTS